MTSYSDALEILLDRYEPAPTPNVDWDLFLENVLNLALYALADFVRMELRKVFEDPTEEPVEEPIEDLD